MWYSLSEFGKWNVPAKCRLESEVFNSVSYERGRKTPRRPLVNVKPRRF